MLPEIWGLFFIIPLGLIVGSFITCISFRIPRGISFFSGRSMCPHCKKTIKWYDNIPLFSYIALGGKCRHCKHRISIRYPLTEFFTAALFGITYLALSSCFQGATSLRLSLRAEGLQVFDSVVAQTRGGVYSNYNSGISSICAFKSMESWALPFLLFNLFILISIFIIDIEHQIIPDELVFLGLFVAFFVFLTGGEDIYPRLLAGFLAGTFLLFLHLITLGRGMGLGDVKFAVYGGFFLNMNNLISWYFLSFGIGAMVGIFLMLTGRARIGQKIAFGPYLIIGLIIAFILGERLVLL